MKTSILKSISGWRCNNYLTNNSVLTPLENSLLTKFNFDKSRVSNQTRNFSIQMMKKESLSNINTNIFGNYFCNKFERRTFSSSRSNKEILESAEMNTKIAEMGKQVELADQLRFEGKYEESLAQLNKVLDFHKKVSSLPTKMLSSLLLIKALVLQDLGRIEEAEPLITKSIELSPSADGYIVLADCQRIMGKVDAAERSFQKAFKWDSTIPGLNSNYGTFLYENNKPGEAIPYFRHEIKLISSSANKDHDEEHMLAGTYINLGTTIFKFYNEKLHLNPDIMEECIESFMKAAEIDGCLKGEAAYSLYTVVEHLLDVKLNQRAIDLCQDMIDKKIFEENQIEPVKKLISDFKEGKEINVAMLPPLTFERGPDDQFLNEDDEYDISENEDSNGKEGKKRR